MIRRDYICGHCREGELIHVTDHYDNDGTRFGHIECANCGAHHGMWIEGVPLDLDAIREQVRGIPSDEYQIFTETFE